MATKTALGNPEENENENENGFEIIDVSEMETVKRGRKAKINESLLKAMKNLPNGKVLVLTPFQVKVSSNADETKKAKAAVSATIRNHAKRAGWAKVSVSWKENGTPLAQRIS